MPAPDDRAAVGGAADSPSGDRNPPLAGYFSRAQWVAFWLVAAAGLVLRWLDLDARPMHHDESLHAMYGRYFYDWPDIQFYKYQPMLHGPFLYNMLRLVYGTFGSTTWGVRFPIALIGSTFIFAPLLFRRYFSPGMLLALTAAVSLSPTIIYWTRFLREDVPQLAMMLVLLCGVTIVRPQRRWLVALLGFTAMFTGKENSYVTAAILLGYIVYEHFFDAAFLHHGRSLARSLWRSLKAYPWHALAALALCALFYCYLYSAGFRYGKGILDGLYRESIGYWLHQHDIERIKGPFIFHLYVLGWYELPFVLFLLWQLGAFYRRAPRIVQFAIGAWTLAALVVAIDASNKAIETHVVWSHLKLKDAFDVFGALLIPIHAVVCTTLHLLRRERALAFWGYLFFASLFSYSFLGEKVPWLTLYPFAAGLVYLALYFDAHLRAHPIASWREYPWELTLRSAAIVLAALAVWFGFEDGFLNPENLWFFGIACLLYGISYTDGLLGIFGRHNLAITVFAVFCIYSVRASLLTNFHFAGAASEYLSQVHTTEEFHDLARSIRREIEEAPVAEKPLVLGTGDVVWPSTWYFVDVPEYKFDAKPAERGKFTYIMQNWDENDTAVPDGYGKRRITLRGWWLPNFPEMTLKKFLRYSLNHVPWNGTGYTYATLLVRNEKRPPQQTAP